MTMPPVLAGTIPVPVWAIGLLLGVFLAIGSWTIQRQETILGDQSRMKADLAVIREKQATMARQLDRLVEPRPPQGEWERSYRR